MRIFSKIITAFVALMFLVPTAPSAQVVLPSSSSAQAYQPQTGFSLFKAKIEKGQNANILIWSDSTGNSRDNTGRWPGRFAAQLAARYPTHSVYLRYWDTTGGTDYDSAVTVSTGSTSASVTIWCFAVSGSVLQYGMGSKWVNGFLHTYPDGLIINHGINYFPGYDAGGTNGSLALGAMQAGIEQFKKTFPLVPISVTVQLPNRDTTALDNMQEYWKRTASQYSVPYIDVYSEYITRGKASALYNADGIHPSEPEGNILWADTIWRHFLDSPPPLPQGPNNGLWFPSPDRNLLVNGDFRTWANTATAPDSWTVSGTVVFTKDTDTPDPSQGYSVKMQGSGAAQAYINQSLPSNVRAYALGKYLTLYVRSKMGVAGATTVGRYSVIVSGGSGITISSPTGSSFVPYRDGWNVGVISGIPIPASGVTGIQVRLYADSATVPDTTNPVWWDQVWLGVGTQPYAAR